MYMFDVEWLGIFIINWVVVWKKIFLIKKIKDCLGGVGILL